MPKDKRPKEDRKKQNKKVNFIDSAMNLKYITRCSYYGKLTDMEYLESGALVIRLACYTASYCTASTTTVRIYIPTDMENEIIDFLTIGFNYFIVCCPYRSFNSKGYPYRVDLALHVFKEVTQ